MAPAQLDFRFLRVTVDGVAHHPVPSHEATARFQDATGKMPFVVREDGTGRLEIEHADVAVFLYFMSGGELAVCMPLDEWSTAFVEVPAEALVAFLVRALTSAPDLSANQPGQRSVN